MLKHTSLKQAFIEILFPDRKSISFLAIYGLMAHKYFFFFFIFLTEKAASLQLRGRRRGGSRGNKKISNWRKSL